MNILRRLAVAVLASLAGVGAASAEKFNELYYQRASIFDALGTDSTSIVFLGNSLTHGCEWHELLRMPNVLNRGINGDIAEGIDLRLDGVLKGQPAKIFLMCGANDVSHDLDADSIATAVEGLIDHIRKGSPRTKIYLQSMLPINNSFGRYKKMTGKEQVIRDINARLKPLAERKEIVWIDLYPLFCDEQQNLRTDLTNDGLHLLAPGYMIWRDAVLPYVTE
ncbi:MAG: GDSL-type esterase/lipase family protein [Muribaculaceae bacterium]|nr:GDSL-type esterase/lipase family protein [Muribaculaceae bacterium]